MSATPIVRTLVHVNEQSTIKSIFFICVDFIGESVMHTFYHKVLTFKGVPLI